MNKKILTLALLSCSTLFSSYIEVQSSGDLASSSGKSIASFYSPDCPHCKVFMPAFKNIADRYSDIPFYGVNIDEHRGLRNKYRVTRTPTVYILTTDGGRKQIKGTGSEVKKAAEEIKNPNATQAFFIPGRHQRQYAHVATRTLPSAS